MVTQLRRWDWHQRGQHWPIGHYQPSDRGKTDSGGEEILCRWWPWLLRLQREDWGQQDHLEQWSCVDQTGLGRRGAWQVYFARNFNVTCGYLRFVLCHVRHFCKADLSISGLPGRHQGDLRRGSFSRESTESALSTSLVRPCVKIVKSKYHLCLFTRMFQKRAAGGQQQLWALELATWIDCCYCDTVEGCKACGKMH